MRNYTTLFVITIGIVILGLAAIFNAADKLDQADDRLTEFEKRCDRYNGAVIYSPNGLMCIEKESVLFSEKEVGIFPKIEEK